MEDLRRDGGALAGLSPSQIGGAGSAPPSVSHQSLIVGFQRWTPPLLQPRRNPQRSSSLIDERLHVSVPSLCSRMSAEVQPVWSGSLTQTPPPLSAPFPLLLVKYANAAELRKTGSVVGSRFSRDGPPSGGRAECGWRSRPTGTGSGCSLRSRKVYTEVYLKCESPGSPGCPGSPGPQR